MGRTFGTRRVDEAYFVICDERALTHPANPDEFQFLVGFAAYREHEYHTYRISHSPNHSKVQAVSLNRLNFAQYSPAELEWVDELAHKLQS